MKKIISAVLLNIALATNSLAEEPPPEIYQASDIPLSLDYTYYETSGTISRPLELQADTGFNISFDLNQNPTTNSGSSQTPNPNSTPTQNTASSSNTTPNSSSNPTSSTTPSNSTTITGTISSNAFMSHTPLWKLGSGHLQLNGDNTYSSNTVLLEGSLGLGHNNALGYEFNMLEMARGTKLVLDPGVDILQDFILFDNSFIFPPAGWPTPAANNNANIIQVDKGTASLSGNLFGDNVINKTGAGTLALNGFGLTFMPLNLQQGGLAVNGVWSSSINTLPGTLLSGTGYIGEVNLAGTLMPGTAAQPGQLYIYDAINMADSASTIIRIQDQNNYDNIYTEGIANLNGALTIKPLKGQLPQGEYTIVSANDLNHSRFKNVYSPKSYLSPVIKYNEQNTCEEYQACQTVTLSMQHNKLGLNYVEPNWLAATIMGSRFARETAIANSAGGKAWARGWFASSDWHQTERDTSGMQIGNSFAVGEHGHIAVYAGAQQSKWRQGYNIDDNSLHAGLAFSHEIGPVQIALGHTISQHKAKISRHADMGETSISSRPKATNSQTWAYAQLKDGLQINQKWSIKPFVEINHTHSRRKAYKEEASSLAAIKTPDQSYTSWGSRLGLNIESQWQTKYGPATMQTSLGLANHWGKNTIKSKQQYIVGDDKWHSTQSLAMPKTSLRLDIGVNAPIAKHSNIHLAYTGEHSSKQKQHGIWGGVEVRF